MGLDGLVPKRADFCGPRRRSLQPRPVKSLVAEASCNGVLLAGSSGIDSCPTKVYNCCISLYRCFAAVRAVAQSEG